MTRRSVAASMAIGVCAMLSSACASAPLHVTRAVAPEDVGKAGKKLVPTAVLHGQARTPIPADALIERDKVMFGRKGPYVHKLQSGDVILAQQDGTISGIRTAAGAEIKFVPGTGSSPAGSDEVRGQLPEEKTVVPLAQGDRIQVEGDLEEGDRIAGAEVVDTRATSALVAGALLFGVSYAPVAYVAFSSPRSGDRILLLPILGPFIDWAGRPACNPPQNAPVDPCAPETAARVGLALSGGLQALGAIAFALGLSGTLVLVDERGHRLEAGPGGLFGRW